jgi:hypothetical protein
LKRKPLPVDDEDVLDVAKNEGHLGLGHDVLLSHGLEVILHCAVINCFNNKRKRKINVRGSIRRV